MNDLRDKIDQEVWTAIARNDEIDNVAVATDRILALIAEAMLSRVPLAAMTKRLVEVSNERVGIEDDVWPDDYNDIVVVGMMTESELGMQAALAAAGITPGDAREGGEGE